MMLYTVVTTVVDLTPDEVGMGPSNPLVDTEAFVDLEKAKKYMQSQVEWFAKADTKMVVWDRVKYPELMAKGQLVSVEISNDTHTWFIELGEHDTEIDN